MAPNQSVALLPEDGAEWDCPTLLDLNAVKAFLKWLNENPSFAARLIDGRWRIGVLESHIESMSNWLSLRRNIEGKKIEVIEYVFGREDTHLVAEIQRAYFGGDANSRNSAEILAYGRRHSDDGSGVRVISRHRCFRFVPNVQLFYVDNAQDLGQNDDATILRLLQSIDLHEKIRKVSFQRILGHEYPDAVDQSIKVLIDEIREIGKLYSLPYVTEIHDQPMVDKALKNREPDGKGGQKYCDPYIQINDHSTKTEKSEQEGYHSVFKGVVSAVRNPLAHNVSDYPFLQSRFGNPGTAIKFICLLSVLLDKLDNRKAPW